MPEMERRFFVALYTRLAPRRYGKACRGFYVSAINVPDAILKTTNYLTNREHLKTVSAADMAGRLAGQEATLARCDYATLPTTDIDVKAPGIRWRER